MYLLESRSFLSFPGILCKKHCNNIKEAVLAGEIYFSAKYTNIVRAGYELFFNAYQELIINNCYGVNWKCYIEIIYGKEKEIMPLEKQNTEILMK